MNYLKKEVSSETSFFTGNERSASLNKFSTEI